MASDLARLRSPAAVQAALDEFASIGRVAFLERYGYRKSRQFLVRDPMTGDLADSKAIVGVAHGLQYPDEGPLNPAEFSGGEATVVAVLQRLGFEVVRIGEDWTSEEVDATVAAYFEMLLLEAREESYSKSERNAELRRALRARTKAAIELKHQNISAILQELGLPWVDGYKPRGNAQLLLRKAVQAYILTRASEVEGIVDSLEDVKTPGEQQYRAVVIDAPSVEDVAQVGPRARLPRKLDHAGRDEANRKLGRAGEHWVLGFEHCRLRDAGHADLYQRVDWISDRLGDGTGYDILSYETSQEPRYIEVKTTNGGPRVAFIISRNELDFAQEVGEAYYLYRVFSFRAAPCLFMMRGDISSQVHLDALDYRASFRRVIA